VTVRLASRQLSQSLSRSAKDVVFVWQRHELFQTAGSIRAARGPERAVRSAAVWQAQWGVRRPGW
jgi:hypothetical protein